MTKIPSELNLLFRGPQRVGRHRRPDGMPNVSIKGSGALLDDEHLYFADMFSHKRARPRTRRAGRPGHPDPERKVAMQVKGPPS